MGISLLQFAELCWFYDRDAVPSMPDGPVPVNIFGKFTEGFDEFGAVCRRMRREGVKRIEVTIVKLARRVKGKYGRWVRARQIYCSASIRAAMCSPIITAVR